MKAWKLDSLSVILFLVFAICSGVFCSCEKGYPVSADDEYLHFTFTKLETRADLSGDGSGNFNEGDKIGLYISDGNAIHYRELTLSKSAWIPSLKRSEFGDGELSLSAHYPVLSGQGGESQEFRLSLDQDGEGRISSDLLMSRITLPEGEYAADMKFGHVMHRLDINLEGDVSDVTLHVRSIGSGKIDLLTGDMELSEGDFQWIAPYRNGESNLQAIIFPQPAQPYREGDGLIRIKSGDKEHFFKLPDMMDGDEPLDYFKRNKETTVHLKLNASTGNEWAGRKVWVYGITPPEESDWKQLFPNIMTTYYLEWKPEYGWYDCNKRNPSNKAGLVPDGMMCWAATASNLIHWWVSCNMRYIEQYGDRYKGPDYVYHSERTNNGGLENTTIQESDIFQCFIDAFANEAGKGDDGVNWFIHGIVPTLPALENGNTAGYFKDVFPDGVRLGSNVGGLGKETFNKAIKDALKNRRGMGVSVGKVTKSHVVTLWGVEFDDEGNVSAIYLADNNDRNTMEYFGVGCIRYEIEYVTMPEGGTMTHYNTGNIDSQSTVPINRLVTLDLGEEYWEKYFMQND